MDEWQRQMEQVHNQADLIIAKQRHGPTGTIQLFFEAEFTRFADLDRMHSESCRRLTRAGAVLEIDLGAIVANWRLLCSAASIRPRRRRGEGGRLRAWRAPGRAGAARGGLPAFLRGTAGRGAGDPRSSAPDAMLAVLGGLIPGSEPDYLAYDVVPVLGSLGRGRRLGRRRARRGRQLPAILHVDTGMARLGLDAARARGAAAGPCAAGRHRPALRDDAPGLRPRSRTIR